MDALGVLSDPLATLDAIRARDRLAFTRLVVALDRDLVRLAYVVTGSREQAEDAAQAAWERLWRRPPHLRDATKLHAWLLSVSANEARQAARRRRRGAILETQTERESPELTDLASDLADLRVALAKLPAADRELLALRFAVELPSNQIAEQLGISAEGARTRLHRVLQRLRKELNHD